MIIKFYIMIMTLFSLSDIIFGYHSWISFLEMITELLSILRTKNGIPLSKADMEVDLGILQLDGDILNQFSHHILKILVEFSFGT